MDTEPTAPLSPAPLAPPPLALAPPPVATAGPTDAAAVAASPAALAEPRVRWAGIVWGAVFAMLAGFALWVLAEASRLDAVREWLRSLSPADLQPGWVIGVTVLAGGVLLLILGGVALLRSAQLRMAVER
ncbi:hypothetical protein ACFC1W_02995 [Microbacterium sp. NPDC056003]|uniref:hypothetical protein n=1 Tax=Microbacterium sp. NPDC056003 TaxID=3345676 RepID=UPI0035D6750A